MLERQGPDVGKGSIEPFSHASRAAPLEGLGSFQGSQQFNITLEKTRGSPCCRLSSYT